MFLFCFNKLTIHTLIVHFILLLVGSFKLYTTLYFETQFTRSRSSYFRTNIITLQLTYISLRRASIKKFIAYYQLDRLYT